MLALSKVSFSGVFILPGWPHLVHVPEDCKSFRDLMWSRKKRNMSLLKEEEVILGKQTNIHPYPQRNLPRTVQLWHMALKPAPAVDVHLSSHFNTLPSCYCAIYRWHEKCNYHPKSGIDSSQKAKKKKKKRNDTASRNILVNTWPLFSQLLARL